MLSAVSEVNCASSWVSFGAKIRTNPKVTLINEVGKVFDAQDRH